MSLVMFVFSVIIHVHLPPTTEEINAIAGDVCLSVCLLARLLKNACVDLDDICVSTGVGTWTN